MTGGLRDFRDYGFSRPRVLACGRYLGHNTYWKLHAIENYLRVLIHSVLMVQLPAPSWDNAVDKKVRERVETVKRGYTFRSATAVPGNHDIYYAYLPDLNRILLANSNFFRTVVPDIDSWIPKLENVVTPRNLVGHMNFPNARDRKTISALYDEFTELISRLEKSNLTIAIP